MEVLTIAGVSIRKLNKGYTVNGRKVSVLKDFNLNLPEQCITVILGKSGCGKTTFLRILGEFEQPDSGQIEKNNMDKTGVVFQEPRLMPWLTVWKNITFGLKKQFVDTESIQSLIELTGLSGFEKAYPHQLSGGMQQRVALARALAYQPGIILMDEPFAALDHFTRENMQNELIDIYRTHQKSIVFVTHSIDEALIIGQKIIMMGNGSVEKAYDLSSYTYPRDLLSSPLIEIKKDILQTIRKK